MAKRTRVVVRRRVDADVRELVRIAARVQEFDGYPGRRPRDLQSFLYAADALSAWVAEYDGAVAGHVAIHRSSLPVVMTQAADALGRDASELGVVARLIVDPTRRRVGIGRALLETAAAGARQHGLHPILDVATQYEAAIALYGSCGWRNVGEVTMVFADGFHLQSFVLVAPE
jgi:GNAT superfamily N-acetyltransferase